MVRKFLAFSDLTSALAERLATLLLFGFCALMLAEIVSRGFLETSLAVSWEYSAYAMAGVFLLGAGPALRHGTQVRVSILLDAAGGRWRRPVDIAATVAALILALLLLSSLWTLFATSLERGTRETSFVATPLAIPQALAPLGAAQLCLDLAARLVRLFISEPTEAERPISPDGEEHDA